MNKLLGKYKNGNYSVLIFDDGTKVRYAMDLKDNDEFIAEFPESFDCKITDYCDARCPMCHENSSIKGKHGDIMNQKFIDTLKPYTEIAIGGGNPLSHPDLIPFLTKLKNKNIIVNLTVNQKHFIDQLNLIDTLYSNNLINGLGISYLNSDLKLLNILNSKSEFYKNIVFHVINGVFTKELYNDLLLNIKDLKLLILGYKDFRRGINYRSQYDQKIKSNQNWLSMNIKEIMKSIKIASFDNLALNQLKIKNVLSSKNWHYFYMGNDGNYTLYIDMVNQEFAKSSISSNRYSILPSMTEMFKIIKKEK